MSRSTVAPSGSPLTEVFDRLQIDATLHSSLERRCSVVLDRLLHDTQFAQFFYSGQSNWYDGIDQSWKSLTFLFQAWNYDVILRYAYLLCVTTDCVSLTAERLASLPRIVRPDTFDFGVSNKVIPLFGIILEGFLVLACLAALIVICFVWKVASSATLYVILLALLLIIEVFQLAHWASLMQTFFSYTSLLPVQILHS